MSGACSVFPYEGVGGGEDEAELSWSSDDVPVSLTKCPRELKCNASPGCSSKVYCVLLPLLQ